MQLAPIPTSHQRARRPVDADSGIVGFFARCYGMMAAGLTLTAGVAWLTAHTPAIADVVFGSPAVRMGLLFAQLAMVVVFVRRAPSASPQAAAGMFFAYSTLVGVTLSVLLVAATGDALAHAFGVTAAAFLGLAGYGAVTQRDLTPVGQFMMVGLIGVIVATVLNLFLHSPGIYWVSTYAGTLIFAGLTAYDSQRLRAMYLRRGDGDNLAVQGALTLYLDFLNLFLFVLRLFQGGNRR